MKHVYIVGGLRTPIGKNGGILKDFLPEQLAAHVLNKIIEKYCLPVEAVEQVILGNAVGVGGNISRVSLLEAGWPYHIPACTIDFQCGSGLSAISIAASQIASEQIDVIIAGGVESTSMAPRRQYNKRDPRFQGEGVFYERAPFSTTNIGDPEMVEGAENVATILGISREDMDAYALLSHQKACRTLNEGILQDIITPLYKNEKVIDMDESIRPDITIELLKRLPSVFISNGKLTAGNTCLKHDGAAAVLLCSEKALHKYKLIPEAVIVAYSSVGCDPNVFHSYITE